jgi:cytochrome b561/polyisoprenoid-binding protein YceI
MPLINTDRSWGSLARAFHWLVALLILTNIGLGLYAGGLPRGSDSDVARIAPLYSLHKTIGVAAFLLALGRILWTLTQPRPGALHPGRRLETFLAETVHWSLYAAMLVMPLSGWLYHAASEGFAPILWPLGQSLPLVPKSPELAGTFKSVHGASARLLILSVALHLAGALKHALLDRDGLLLRMVTGRAAGTGATAHGRLAPLVALAAWGALIAAGVALAPPPPGVAGASTAAAGGNWAVAEGNITFTVRQMQADIHGTFDAWTARITYDATSKTGAVDVTIPLSGLRLGAVTRQAAGPEFFDLARHPTATFRAAIAESAGQMEAKGTLSLRGRDVPVTLPFTLAIDGDRATMTGETVLDRRDFGMGPGFPGETTVGFAVRVSVALTAARQ